MLIKICGITNESDAAAAVEAGADALGFNFYSKSPRYLSPKQAAGIVRNLPAGVCKVGIFVNEEARWVREVMAAANLDVAQLHGGAAGGIRHWRAIPVRDQAPLPPDDGAEALLLDTASAMLHGGTGIPFRWELARGLGYRVVLAGGLDEHNVGEAIRAAEPWGVDACSRLESQPGQKNHDKLRRFVEAARMQGA